MLRRISSLFSGNNHRDLRKKRGLNLNLRGKFESLEDRRMLTTYDLLSQLDNPAAGLNNNYDFGDAIAINNNGLIAVGAARADDFTTTGSGSGVDQGAAFVYSENSTSPLFSYQNPDSLVFAGDSGDNFGWDVAINDNNIIAVSAPLDRVIVPTQGGSAQYSGAGSVWFKDIYNGAWNRIDHPDPVVNGRFGEGIALSGNILIVAAEQDGLNNNDNGVVYAFDLSSQNYDQPVRKWVNINNIASRTFGHDVSADGSWAVIGEQGHWISGLPNQGRFHLWNFNTGSVITVNNPTPGSSGVAGDHFGSSVDISANGSQGKIAVSAPLDDTLQSNAGVVYLYDFNTSSGSINTSNVEEVYDPLPISPPDGLLTSNVPDIYGFGGSVALSNTQLVVGAPKISNNGYRAYVYDHQGNLLDTFNDQPYNSEITFGREVEIASSRNLIAIGAPDDQVTQFVNRGIVFVFADNSPIKFDVNTELDLPDLNPGDGIVNTGQFVSGQPAISLRAAIQEANALLGHPPVTICLPEGHYVLNRVGVESTIALYNDLDITGDITIVGAGAGLSVIDGSGLNDRVFQVVGNSVDIGSLSLSGVTVTGGSATLNDLQAAIYPVGGGILVDPGGELSLDKVSITGNHAYIGGGVRLEEGSKASIIDTVFTNNIADFFGGALDSHNTNNVLLTVGGTVFANNFALGDFNTSFGSSFALGSNSLGNNRLDDANVAATAFFSTVGDVVTTRDLNRLIVNSLRDENNFSNNLVSFSLREAVLQANGTVGAGEIWLPSWDLNLTKSGTEFSNATSNDLDITSDITIVGTGAGLTVIDATGLNDRVFQIISGALSLSGMTVTGGSAVSENLTAAIHPVGGGILANAYTNLSLNSVAIVGNQADIGGGVRLEENSVATITDSVFTGNDASLFGGAIDTHGTMNVMISIGSTIFANNTAGGGFNATFGNSFAAGSGSLGYNRIDDVNGANSFFNGSGDVVTTRDLNRLIVTSLRDESTFLNTTSSFSIREAVLQANATPGANEIWLPAWDFVLSKVGSGGAEIGDIDIDDNVAGVDITLYGIFGNTTIFDDLLGESAFDEAFGEIDLFDAVIV